MDRQLTGNSTSPAAANEADELLSACADGDHALVRELLAVGVPLEGVDANGRTPLGLAAATGELGLVRLLLEAGADVNAASEQPPARGVGSSEARRIAAREGVDFRTPLTCAVESGELEVVEALLVAGANPYGGGATNPLELAVLLGDEEIVRSLLDAGADPNARDSEGDTPLMIAAAAGQVEPIEVLLAYGAIVSARNDDGESAIALAGRAGRSDAVEHLAPHASWSERFGARRALARHRRGRPPRRRASLLARTERFHDDALHGRLAAVRKALAAGVDPDTRWNDRSDTALVLAAEGGHVAVVRALLEAGADPNGLARGETPLGRALGGRCLDRRAVPDVVRALVRGGADVEVRDADGLTPLMRAVVDGRGDARTFAIVDTLVDLGARIDASHAADVTAAELARLDPAKAELAAHLDRLADKQAEGTVAPTTAAAAARADGPVEALRGFGERDASCVVLAVRAPIDRVAPALEAARGGRQWNRDVYATDGPEGWFAGEEGYVVYRLREHAWTLAQSPFVDGRALHARDAQRLAAELGCDALLLEACAASSVLRYAMYRGDERVEEFGLRKDGDVAFRSAIAPEFEQAAGSAADAGDAFDVLDRRLAELDLYLPGTSDDRIDWLARRFAARDFERVDFLRLDEEAS